MGIQVEQCETYEQVMDRARRTEAKRRQMFARKEPSKPPVAIPIVDHTPEPEPVVVEAKKEIELPEYPYPKVRAIIRHVAKKYNVKVLDILSDRRSAGFVYPRHIAFHLACLLTPHSLPFLGKHFGDRDHTSIAHGHKRMMQRRADDPALDAELEAFAAEIMKVECDVVD